MEWTEPITSKFEQRGRSTLTVVHDVAGDKNFVADHDGGGMVTEGKMGGQKKGDFVQDLHDFLCLREDAVFGGWI